MAAQRNSDSWTKSIFRSLPVCLLLLLLPVEPAPALDPGQPANSYVRAHFGESEGLRGNVVNGMVQSRDGFLWLIVGSGLARFDGQHFNGFDQPSFVRAIALAPDCDLWVGTNHDLEQIPAGALNGFDRLSAVSSQAIPGNGNEIRCLHFSRRGILWVGTSAGLYRFDAGVFSSVIPQGAIERIEETASGHLLVVSAKGFMELDDSKIVPHPDLATQLDVGTDGIFHVLEDTHGVTWFCTTKGVARRVGGALEKLPGYGRSGLRAIRAYEDPNGNVWIATATGLFRASATGLEVAAADLDVRYMYGDRAGDLWVGTNGGGLFRFKDSAARIFTTADGLPNNLVMTVLATHDGAIWSGFNCGGLSRFDGKHFQNYNEKNGLSNSCVWSLAEDAQGDLWIGTYGGGLFRFHNGRFTQFSKAQGLADDVVVAVVAAHDGSIWFATPPAVGHLRDGQVRNYSAADGLSSTARGIYEDRAGGIWVGTLNGLDRLVGDRFVNVSSFPEPGVSLVGEDRTGKLYLTRRNAYAPGGILRIEEKRPVLLAEEGKPGGMVETAKGEMWFAGVSIFRVPSGGLDHPHVGEDPLDFEVFAEADGLPVGQASFGRPDAALSADGKLWIATAKGLVMLDLPRLPRSDRRPTIYLEGVTVGRNQQRPGSEIVLPAATHHLELNFDAIEIGSPEKTRLQYRMDGVDSEWLDADSPGHAIYSTLSPGKHAFHIRACNSNGIWDRSGIVYGVTQQPYFYQTHWFLVLCSVFGLFVIAALYQLRMHQAVARLNMRMEERLNERTRIARELHDTLLQSLHGLMFQFQGARNLLPRRPDEAMRSLDEAIGETKKALAESRDAIQGLRLEPMATGNLAELLTSASRELAGSVSASVPPPVFDLIEEGEQRMLSPATSNEIGQIVLEILRNAYRHAHARRIEAEIRYGDQTLRLRIRDDGKGIDPDVLEEGGRAGHWGLRGIRERAERIGAGVDFWSEVGEGTEVELTIPAAVAYESSRDTHRAKLVRKVKSRAQRS